MRPLTNRWFCRVSLALATCAASCLSAAGQQVALAGLRSQNHAGAFRGLKHDAAGNIYTLFAAGDGLRILKLNADGTQVLAEAHLGQAGDNGIALDVDAAGDVFVAGTSLSNGSITGTTGTAFPNRTDTTTNSFVARFTPDLTEQWLTFCGSGRTSVSAISVSGSSVLVTGTIYLAGLPVTSGGVQQSPAPASNTNGFVESFSAAAGTLNYATYLTGANGDTSPSAIVADAGGSAYITGNTTATGFPTTAALVPQFRATAGSDVSGFLTELNAAGDGFVFSTFVPGAGLTSLALDASGAGSVLVSGNIAPGLFPVAQVVSPLVPLLTYQSAARISLDGSSVLSSTLLAPGTSSLVAADSTGGMWVFGSQQSAVLPPLLPLQTVEGMGNAFALHVASGGRIDRAARLGGMPTANSSYARLPVMEGGVIVAGTDVFLAAGIAPTLSSDLLETQRFDLPLVASPNSSMPSAVRDALPSASCSGSACAGGAGMLVRLQPDATAPSLSLSADDLPNLTLRNYGTAAADSVSITASGFTVNSSCPGTLQPGGECSIALAGEGPGSITVSSSGGSFTTQLPAASQALHAISVLPREVDFGIQTSGSAASTRTLTVVNQGSTLQTFSSVNAAGAAMAYTLTEQSSTCAPAGDGVSKVLAAGGSCTITLALSASTDPANDGPVNAHWQVGDRDVLVTGYAQAAATSLSASTIDFGRQFTGGLRVSRYLYLSNSSDLAQSHAASASTDPAFSIVDECPSTLQPHSVCRIALTYNAPYAPSSNAMTLNVDALAATILGETLPQPSITGASTNPNLTVSATSTTFSNVVTVTTASGETHAITIGNTGVQPFALALALTGDFTETTDCPATLGGGASCTVTVAFTPTAPGLRQGLLSVSAGSASPVYVALSGTGTAILPANNGVFFGDVPLLTPSVQWLKVFGSFTSLSVTSQDPSFKAILVEDTGYGHGSPAAAAFGASATGSCLSCYLGIQFSPTLAGTHRAALSITSPGAGRPELLQVSGNGDALTGLILTPVSEDFGPLAVHSSTSETIFQLTNGAAAPIAVSTASATGDFTITSDATGGAACQGASLDPGASCFIPVHFAPAATGTRTGTLAVLTSAGQATSALSGTGVDDPGIAFTPAELRFDNVPGVSAQQSTLTITNTSSSSATIGTVSSSDSHFVAATACAALAPGAACTVRVNYVPGALLASGVLTIPVTTAPAGIAQTATYAIAVSGQYTSASAGLQIIPGEHTTVNFGAEPIDVPGSGRVLHVNNLSGTSLKLTAQAPRQFAVTSSTCNTVAAGAGCDLTVLYTPLTAGDTTGTVLLQGASSDSSVNVSGLAYMEGYGSSSTSLTVSGNLSPEGVLSFGQVTSGSTAAQTITLTNPASASGTFVTVRRVRSEFPFQSSTNCGAPLSAGESCTVTITYAPQFQASAGGGVPLPEIDTGTISIESDAANSPLLLDLSGSASAALVSAPGTVAPIAAFDLSQGALNFGVTAVGSSSPAQTVIVTNSGTVTVHVQHLSTTTPSFAVSSDCGTLQPGGTCSVSVSYVPQTAGTSLASLEIATDASASLDFVSLLGSASPASVSLAPQSIDFGRILVGASAVQSATLTNTGSTAVTMGAVSISGADFQLPDSSTLQNPCPPAGGTIGPGAVCTVAVVFAPSTTGTERGTLAVGTSATPLPLSVALSGVGTKPQLAVTPGSLSFGTVPLGGSATLSLTLSNISTLPVDGLTFSATNPDFTVTSKCGITTLPAGSSCAVSVTYTPSASGTATGTLKIISSDPASPVVVALNGNAAQGGSFTLQVNGGSNASATVQQGIPAIYALTVTPTGGYTGSVALTCTPDSAVQYISCSVSPSTVSLTDTPQSSTVTINTLSAVSVARTDLPGALSPTALLCLTPAVLLLASLRRRRLTALLALVFAVAMCSGACGGGGDPRIRYAGTGNYSFHVTAASTNTVPVQQTVSLTLTVTSR